MQVTTIIDYGSGNLRSAAKAFERAARERGIHAQIKVTSDPGELQRAERIVLPGVGAFHDCIAGLHKVDGLVETICDEVIRKGKPFLGICVGMQLMADKGLEHQVTTGLGWLRAEVKALEPSDPSLKIPHMGWNTVSVCRSHPLTSGLSADPTKNHAYFVHSYHMLCQHSEDHIATTDYGGPIVAIVGKDNFAGAQFHPEKSQSLGINFLANFLEWCP